MTEKASPWFIERYTVARRIWAIKDQRAHDGFTDKRSSRSVPAQTWAEWFEWAYGMPLADYAKLASDGKHGEQVPKETAVLVEYQLPGSESWYICRGAPGDTYEKVAKFLTGNYGATATRKRGD